MVSNLGEKNYQQLVREGILAAKSGNRPLAIALLQKALRENPGDSRAWLWLTETTDDPDQKRQFLENAVAADPGNTAARRGLALLSGRLAEEKVLPEGAGIAAREPDDPEDATGYTFLCPDCGGRLTFGPTDQNLACEYCGNTIQTEQEPATEAAEQPIDFVLPTSEGHRWAEAQHRLACKRCGAVTLLPPGERTSQCPYCGSNHLVESAETSELIDPQVIGLMKVDEDAARKSIGIWLQSGLFTPDNVSALASRMELRSAYYPFWTFDGTLETAWRCEVRSGGGNSNHWMPSAGVEIMMFDDVLIPALKSIASRDLTHLAPFELKELVEFRPEHLAGWVALTYDRALADASLLAREIVTKRMLRQLHRRVEPGQEKRNLRAGAGKWSGLTFKHVLLPLWAGTYRYQGNTFRVLVNAQTGKVSGEKPRDQVKVTLLWVAGAVVTVIFLLIAMMLLMAYGDQLSSILQIFFQP